MADTPTPEAPKGRYRTEVVIEEIDNSRQRRVLSILLVVLLVLLSVVGYFVWQFTRISGAPANKTKPDGMTWMRSIYGWGKTPDTLLNDPTDAAVAPDGTIWTISNKTTVVGFNPNGTPKKVVAFQRGGGEGQVGSIEGLAVGEDGLVYLADFGLNEIHVMDPNGTILRSWGVQLPNDLAVKDGKVAVAAAYGIGVFDTNGKLINQFGSRGGHEEQVDLPHGIAWGQDGNIYVADTQNKRIKAYRPDGRLIYIMPESQKFAKRQSSLAEGMSENATDTNPYQLPAGMTVDGAGRVVLVDPFDFSIMAHDPKTGRVTNEWGEYGREDGSFAYPTGIDYDESRDYYVVADTTNNRLQIIQLQGSGGSAALSNVRRMFDGPVWVCLIPLLLLLAAFVLSVMRRRKRNAAEAQGGEAVPAAGTEGDAPAGA